MRDGAGNDRRDLVRKRQVDIEYVIFQGWHKQALDASNTE